MTNVLIMATNGFEQSELMGPMKRLNDAGIDTTIASIETGEIKGWKDGNWGESVKVDTTLGEVSVDDFDALLLPGGQINPDILRTEDDAIDIVRSFNMRGKPIAAICHAPWLLVEADIGKGKTVTSWPSLRTDLTNAGGKVVDQEVAEDGNLITSRNPDDIPAFSNALIAQLKNAMAEAA